MELLFWNHPKLQKDNFIISNNVGVLEEKYRSMEKKCKGERKAAVIYESL